MSTAKSQHVRRIGFLLLAASCAVLPYATTAQQPTSSLITSSALTVDGTGKIAYAVDAAHDMVLRLDLTTGARRSFQAGKEPIALALDATGQQLYVVDAGAGVVSVLDTQTGATLAQPRTDTRPYTIAVDRSLGRAYVSNTFSNQVTVIDMRQNTGQAMPWGSKDNILVDEQRSRVFFTSYEDPSLTVLEEHSGAVTRFPVANHSWAMALIPTTGHLLITEVGGDSVFDVDPITRRTVRIETGAMPDSVAVSGSDVYVANRESNTVSRISLDRAKVVSAQQVGSHPQAVAVDHGLVWSANTGDRSVTVWNEACPARPLTLRTAGAPYSLKLAGAETAVVAEFGDKAVELLHAPESLQRCKAN